MQFRIKALLLATIVVALLFRLVMSLQNSSYFCLIPVVIAGIGYVFGKFLRRPIFLAILAVWVFGLYGLTMPLIEQYGSATRWPSGTLGLFELYCIPFYAWADTGTNEWFWYLFYIWMTFCSMVPMLAILLLGVGSIITAWIGLRADGMWATGTGNGRSLSTMARKAPST